MSSTHTDRVFHKILFHEGLGSVLEKPWTAYRSSQRFYSSFSAVFGQGLLEEAFGEDPPQKQ